MSRQLNLGLRGFAMFHNVPQSLLDYPKEAQSYILRDLARNVMIKKLDFQFVLVGEFSAEAFRCRHQALKVQFNRVKSVRYVMKIARDFGCDSREVT